jgi:hypothetical protein
MPPAVAAALPAASEGPPTPDGLRISPDPDTVGDLCFRKEAEATAEATATGEEAAAPSLLLASAVLLAANMVREDGETEAEAAPEGEGRDAALFGA